MLGDTVLYHDAEVIGIKGGQEIYGDARVRAAIVTAENKDGSVNLAILGPDNVSFVGAVQAGEGIRRWSRRKEDTGRYDYFQTPQTDFTPSPTRPPGYPYPNPSGYPPVTGVTSPPTHEHGGVPEPDVTPLPTPNPYGGV